MRKMNLRPKRLRKSVWKMGRRSGSCGRMTRMYRSRLSFVWRARTSLGLLVYANTMELDRLAEWQITNCELRPLPSEALSKDHFSCHLRRWCIGRLYFLESAAHHRPPKLHFVL